MAAALNEAQQQYVCSEFGRWLVVFNDATTAAIATQFVAIVAQFEIEKRDIHAASQEFEQRIVTTINATIDARNASIAAAFVTTTRRCARPWSR